MCKIFNKDGRLFAIHSLTYFNENAFLSTWVLIKIREFSQLLSTTGCSTKTIILFLDILWTSIFIIIVKKTLLNSWDPGMKKLQDTFFRIINRNFEHFQSNGINWTPCSQTAIETKNLFIPNSTHFWLLIKIFYIKTNLFIPRKSFPPLVFVTKIVLTNCEKKLF